ncbi:MAG: fimbrillin family protein [Bacteroidales bacterium]|nr:fimbrillin family protein [Bacteroidales bacterium]
MKKLFFIAAVAGAALASCAENDPAPQTLEQQVITLSPVVASSSRAQSEMGVEYNQTTPFKVWALYYDDVNDGGEYTEYADGQAFMNFITASYETATNSYVPKDASGNNFYWPKNGSLTFMAVSPADAVTESTVAFTANGLKFTGYTVPNDGSQYDLLISERAYNKTTSTDGTPYFGGVDMEFKHALSSVVFKAKLDKTYLGTTIRLKGITINDIGSKANFSQNLDDEPGIVTNCPNRKDETNKIPEANEGNNDVIDEKLPTVSSTPAAWTAPTNEIDYTVAGIPAAGKVLSTTAYWPATGAETEPTWSATNIRNTDFMLLPQTVAGKTITINYSIQHGTGVELDQTFDYTITPASEWEMGYRYIYTIEFGFDPILLAPSVQVWENSSVLGVEP